ncbi:MAG: hypothetical protein KGD66_02230 [Candidatus Lokiarchaeota archaeon]|nr:hypothetical protein [Candidatus Lokiarchaeota archaeon]
MSKDIKNTLDNIESSENLVANAQAKANRLQELIEKQKRVISDQDVIIEEQKSKISRMYDVPEDILELKELIGTQRALLNEKEMELDHAKGNVIQIETELELYKKQSEPIHKRLDETYESIGTTKAELAEKKSEVLLKTERIKNLENKVREIRAFADKLQDEQVKILNDMDKKGKSEVESIRKEYLEEKNDANAKLREMNQMLLDSKLISTEASSDAKDIKSRFEEILNKQEDLIHKNEVLRDEKRNLEAEIRKFDEKMKVLRNFKEENEAKITYYDRLTPLMEQEAQFKAFLIIEKVKSISLDDLRNAMGSPIVLIKKIVQNLQDADLLEIDDVGKFHVKSIEK